MTQTYASVHRDRALGSGEHRVQVELGDLGQVDRELREPVQEVSERLPVDRRRAALPPPSAYYDRLKPLAARVDIWHTTYNHPMADAAAIVEWFKGSGLRPYLDLAGPEHREAFQAAYLKRIEAAYPKLADGGVLLRFPRLFIVAVR